MRSASVLHPQGRVADLEPLPQLIARVEEQFAEAWYGIGQARLGLRELGSPSPPLNPRSTDAVEKRKARRTVLSNNLLCANASSAIVSENG